MEEVTATLTPEAVAKLKKEMPEKYNDLPDEGMTANIIYEFGETVSDAVGYFGEEVCKNMIKGHILFSLQSYIRSLLSRGFSPADIQEKIFSVDDGEHVWKPSEGRTRKSELEKYKDKLSKLSPEERARQKEKLMAMLEEME
jgi:hypothetical protein